MSAAELTALRDNAERLSLEKPEASEEDRKKIALAWEVMALVDREIGARKNQMPSRK